MKHNMDLLMIYEVIKRNLIGLRIDNRRREMKISMTQLAHRLGLPRNELEQCLLGKAEIYADTLWNLSKILETKVDYFFEDLNALNLLR